ncbi:hypothetical protein ACFVT5_33565 [Streptomyces sp. NPDC058001]|uniref:hypothetical protein n=1 Tax=Streptomyces sp. NPDC058001 TaxID=3346300 RepID=UPI0036E04D67
MRRPLAAAVTGLVLVTAAGAAACSSSSHTSANSSAASSSGADAPASSSSPGAVPAESNPPGDIPDTQVFVPYAPSGGGLTVKVPEGWSRTAQGGATVFSDKFNTVKVERVAATSAPTVNSVRSQDIPAVRSASKNFSLVKVTDVRRAGGSAVLAEYRVDSPPDQVTGKSVQLDVQRYVFYRAGQGTAVLTLSGAVGADNVDPWRIVTDSFRWS